jgi:hypothetical protein
MVPRLSALSTKLRRLSSRDAHVRPQLPVVRKGRRRLIPVRELER